MSRYDGPRKLPCMATVDPSGEITFGFGCPKGSVTALIAQDEKLARKILEPKARLAHDGETWLVPGVPEADSQPEAMEALIRWVNWVHDSLPIRPGQTLHWPDLANRPHPSQIEGAEA